MTVAVVTDSTASLDESRAAEAGVRIVPIGVMVGAQSYVDGPEVTSETIARALRDFVPVNTSRPNPAEFAEVFEQAADDGAESIVSVHLSQQVSGTYDSARLAAQDAPVPVEVVDTGQVGIATGFIALNAARAAAEGRSIDGVAGVARAAATGASTFFYVDTLEYLRRGGRVGAAAALIGSALAVKPLLSVVDGAISPIEKVRTSSRALGRLHDIVIERAAEFEGRFEVGVQHLDAEHNARTFADKIAGSLGFDEVEVTEVSASIAAHVGPGMISVALVPHMID